MALSSTIAYCENQDVFDIYQIDKFDLKRKLFNGVLSGGNYYYYNSGNVSRLFKNGEDLGAMEEDVGQVDRPDEWFYNSTGDVLILNQASLYGGTDPNLDIIEAGDIWEDVIERFRRKASRLIEAKLGKSITREILKDREGNYPNSIIHITALKTAILLIMGHNPNHPDLISLNAEYDTIVDKILSGKVVMTGHRSENDSKGFIREVAVDANAQLYLAEIKGNYIGSDYELLKVIVDSGDGFGFGVATYSVYGKSTTTLKSKQLVKSKTINGDYQETGVGNLEIRWAGDDIDAFNFEDDEYEIELWGSGIQPTVSQLKPKELDRGRSLWR